MEDAEDCLCDVMGCPADVIREVNAETFCEVVNQLMVSVEDIEYFLGDVVGYSDDVLWDVNAEKFCKYIDSFMRNLVDSGKVVGDVIGYSVAETPRAFVDAFMRTVEDSETVVLLGDVMGYTADVVRDVNRPPEDDVTSVETVLKTLLVDVSCEYVAVIGADVRQV